MLNPMSMNELSKRTATTTEDKEHVLGLVKARAAELQKKKDLDKEMERISLGIEEYELKAMKGKMEIRRLRALRVQSNKTLTGLTNARIADKLEITLQQVNNITANRTSYK